MVATTVRKSLLTVLMVFTIMAGLITGFAHTKTAALSNTPGTRTTHGQVADWCPAPPKECLPQRVP